MNFKTLFLILTVCFYSFKQEVKSQESDYFSCINDPKVDKNITKQVDTGFSKISSVSSDFTQISVVAGFDFKEEIKGKLSFLKGGKMRWEYLGEDKQLFVNDGENLWFYRPELNTVIKSVLEPGFLSSIPVSFLLGIGSLNDNFNLGSICNTEKGLMLNYLPKKADPSLKSFYLVVSKEKKLPLAAWVEDFSQNTTKLILTNVEYDNKVSDELFTFKIPEGTDVIIQ